MTNEEIIERHRANLQAINDEATEAMRVGFQENAEAVKAEGQLCLKRHEVKGVEI